MENYKVKSLKELGKIVRERLEYYNEDIERQTEKMRNAKTNLDYEISKSIRSEDIAVRNELQLILLLSGESVWEDGKIVKNEKEEN